VHSKYALDENAACETDCNPSAEESNDIRKERATRPGSECDKCLFNHPSPEQGLVHSNIGVRHSKEHPVAVGQTELIMTREACSEGLLAAVDKCVFSHPECKTCRADKHFTHTARQTTMSTKKAASL
jgi:hypothetical protein